MAIPRNRDEFKQRVLSELGEPVIKVNISDGQLDNAVDDAIDFYRDFHVDGNERFFLMVQMPSDETEYQELMKSNQITLPKNVFAVMNVHNSLGGIGGSSSSISSGNYLSDFYQLNQSMAFNIISNINDSGNSLPMTTFIMQRQYLNDISSLTRVYLRYDYRYSHNSENKLTFHDDLSRYVKPNGYLVIECQGFLDEVKNLYGSRELRKLASAYAKKQWGMNLKKYSGVTLPSGLTLNGESIYNDALHDIEQAEQFIKGQQEPHGIVIA